MIFNHKKCSRKCKDCFSYNSYYSRKCKFCEAKFVNQKNIVTTTIRLLKEVIYAKINLFFEAFGKYKKI